MNLIVKNNQLFAGNMLPVRCAIGKLGLTHDKGEGDNKTPIGTFALRGLFYRPDRITLPETKLRSTPISPYDGWCDDVTHADYNMLVKLPHPARHEQLWHENAIYDIIIPLGYNDAPVVAGKGSAIFFHIAHDDYRGTEGCVAISIEDMLALLPHLSTDSVMKIAD